MDLPFGLFSHVFVFNRLLLLTCENKLLFSVLHLAVKHGREQLVDQVLQLIKQVHSTELSLIDSQNITEYVSDL